MSAEADFVVNKYLLAERRGQKPLLSLLAPATVALALFFIVAETGRLFPPHLQPFLDLLCKVLACVYMLCVLDIFVNRLYLEKPYPTNIVIGQDDISMQWRLQSTKKLPPLPLSSCLSAFYLPRGNGVVRLTFDISSRDFLTRRRLVLGLGEMRPFNRPFDVFKGDLTVDLDLDALTLAADRERLLQVLDHALPPQIKDQEFVKATQAIELPSYTALWLDDLSSYRRRREGEELSSGDTLKECQYTVERKLATGGQAKLYLAFDSADQRKVVLKEFVLPVSAGAEVRKRSFAAVKSEAELLSSLSHPGVVVLYDHFVEDHRAYFVLEYIEGDTLSSLGALRRCSTDEILALTREAAEILRYLHELAPPVVHRDITPDNFILSKSRGLRLIDFNVARLAEADKTRTVVGKHSYMAPEQFRGKACPQSDLYSLGCTIYYLFTGKDPLPLAPAKPSSESTAEGAEIIDELVAGLTAADLTVRYASAAVLVEALDRLEGGEKSV